MQTFISNLIEIEEDSYALDLITAMLYNFVPRHDRR